MYVSLLTFLKFKVQIGSMATTKTKRKQSKFLFFFLLLSTHFQCFDDRRIIINSFSHNTFPKPLAIEVLQGHVSKRAGQWSLEIQEGPEWGPIIVAKAAIFLVVALVLLNDQVVGVWGWHGHVWGRHVKRSAPYYRWWRCKFHIIFGSTSGHVFQIITLRLQQNNLFGSLSKKHNFYFVITKAKFNIATCASLFNR